MQQMGQHLQTVVDAAERAAEAIRADAERKAREHMAEAQRKADQMTAERVRLIAELTDGLIQQTSTARDRSERMARELEDAVLAIARFDQQRLDEGAGTMPAAPSSPSIPSGAGGDVPNEPPGNRSALTFAARLAVTGSDRATIERSLRDEYGLTDPASVTDRIMGPQR
jgi:hypothetical protein